MPYLLIFEIPTLCVLMPMKQKEIHFIGNRHHSWNIHREAIERRQRSNNAMEGHSVIDRCGFIVFANYEGADLDFFDTENPNPTYY
jgi:hypothetical protein